MPTTKHRLNISLSSNLEKALAYLAERDEVPQATKAAELLQRGLEVEEDEVWNAIAEKRDTPRARFVSPKQAWT